MVTESERLRKLQGRKGTTFKRKAGGIGTTFKRKAGGIGTTFKRKAGGIGTTFKCKALNGFATEEARAARQTIMGRLAGTYRSYLQIVMLVPLRIKRAFSHFRTVALSATVHTDFSERVGKFWGKTQLTRCVRMDSLVDRLTEKVLFGKTLRRMHF